MEAWHAAGFPFGNHTWSHKNLNQHSLGEFEADSSRNEPLLREWVKGEDWHWFRFPFLAEGDTPEKKRAIRSFLLQHHYKVSAVTVSWRLPMEGLRKIAVIADGFVRRVKVTAFERSKIAALSLFARQRA